MNKALIKKITRMVTEKVDSILLNELNSQNSDKFYGSPAKDEENIFIILDELKIKTVNNQKPFVFIIGKYVPLNMNVVVMIKNYDEIYIARVIKTNLININDQDILNEIADSFEMELTPGNAKEQFNSVFNETKPAKDFTNMINNAFKTQISYKNFLMTGSINESLVLENAGREVFTLNALEISEDEPIENMKYMKEYFSETEAIMAAREWAEDLSIDSDDVICVTVLRGEYKSNGDITGEPYDVYTISSQDEDKTRLARKRAGYVRDTVDEYSL